VRLQPIFAIYTIYFIPSNVTPSTLVLGVGVIGSGVGELFWCNSVLRI
jgi:hypothetical protein